MLVSLTVFWIRVKLLSPWTHIHLSGPFYHMQASWASSEGWGPHTAELGGLYALKQPWSWPPSFLLLVVRCIRTTNPWYYWESHASSFSAKESFTSAKATSNERQEKQEEEPHWFPQKDSESARGLWEPSEVNGWFSTTWRNSFRETPGNWNKDWPLLDFNVSTLSEHSILVHFNRKRSPLPPLVHRAYLVCSVAVRAAVLDQQHPT